MLTNKIRWRDHFPDIRNVVRQSLPSRLSVAAVVGLLVTVAYLPPAQKQQTYAQEMAKLTASMPDVSPRRVAAHSVKKLPIPQHKPAYLVASR